MATAQFTTLLPNDVLSRVERMRLNPMKRRTNRMHGEHISGKGGTSIEFSDFRDYVAGDDLRYVDWNIFSRLNQAYIKLYAHEEEMHVPILIDGSSSMHFQEKFELARQLAAALGIMALHGVEKVSVYACGDRKSSPLILPPAAGRQNLKRFVQFLEKLEPGGTFPVEAAIEEVLKRHRGKGIAVILSDFLTFGDIPRAFNQLFNAGLEIYAIQILAPLEINPELTGDLRLVDSENSMTLDISSAGELLGIYHEHRMALESHLASESRKRNGRFVTVSSADPVKAVLFDNLLRRGWIR